IAKARPIKTQSAGMARAMASICNAEWAGLGGQSGHEGFFLNRGLSPVRKRAVSNAKRLSHTR
ncbi:MAG: hypothetical protein WCZ18_08520, partial [Ottowia sp.]